MRKVIWLATTAAICLSSPVMAGGKSGSSGSSQGNGNGVSNGKGNGQSNGNGNGAANGNGNGNGQSNASSGNNGHGQGNAGSSAGGNGSIATPPVVCGVNDLSVAALACSGFYSGNLLSNAQVAAQVTGLKAIGFDWNGDFTALDAGGQKFDGHGATTLDFSTPLAGLTVLGIHFGGGGPNGVGNGTAFYLFDAGSSLSALGLNYPGSSGVVIYSTHAVTPPPSINPPPSGPITDPLPPLDPPGNTLPVSDPQPGAGAVPEPASWALMIGGFGMIGAAMRRRRTAARYA